MICEKCQKQMKQKNPYEVSGSKHGIPGRMIPYVCECGHMEKIFAIKLSRYEQYRERLFARISEETTISSHARIKVYQLEQDLQSGSVKRQVDNLLHILKKFKGRLP